MCMVKSMRTARGTQSITRCMMSFRGVRGAWCRRPQEEQPVEGAFTPGALEETQAKASDARTRTDTDMLGDVRLHLFLSN